MTPDEPKPGGVVVPFVVADDPVPTQGWPVTGFVPDDPSVEPGLVFGLAGDTGATRGAGTV